MVSGYSRLALAICFWSSAAAAQQGEVQFLRSWQPANKEILSEPSGMALGADGTLYLIERERGALWRIAGEAATAIELAGKDLPFDSKKTGGVAWLGGARVAVANTRNDLLATLDADGRAERVFASGGKGDG